jgi:glycosyltransferase involved in cell wall biosynthesis
MRIQIIDGSTRFSGGRRMLYLHANELVRRGHDVTLWVGKEPRIDWLKISFSLRCLEGGSLGRLPECDVCLFQRWRFARQVWHAARGIPVHFCQGYEGTDAENRIAQALVQPWRNLPLLVKLWRRLRRLHQAYATATVKIVVHQPLRDLLARRYQQSAYFVPYGLADEVFAPPEEPRPFTPTVLVVGPASIGWKRTGDAVAAVRVVKQRRPGVRLVRVSPEPIDPVERQSGIIDEYHSMLNPEEMAEQYRRAALLVVPSDATEGFGLPALEAMACGTPVVLTDIPSFRSFARPMDYAEFVPVGRPDLLAAAIEHLLDRPARREQLSARGLEVAAGYTMERSYQAMSETLAEVVSRRGKRFLPPCKK